MTTWTSEKKNLAMDRHKADTTERRKDKTQEPNSRRAKEEGLAVNNRRKKRNKAQPKKV